MPQSVSWLHISDVHIKASDSYDRDTVLSAFLDSLPQLIRRGPAPQLIFFTGDLANSGQPGEYDAATIFFDKLLSITKLEKNRLFVVPGNHDIDRTKGIGLVRTLDSAQSSSRYFEGNSPLLHLTQRMSSFAKWYDEYFEGDRNFNNHSSCGNYEAITVDGVRIGVLPINTATFSIADDDHGKLWIGRRCLDNALSAVREKTDVISLGS